MNSLQPGQTKCGFIAVIGIPNAGKSTLINRLVGEKVSITSRKSQTTRFRVRGIFIKDATQVVLIDTPGIFKASARLEKAMVKAAWDGLAEADSSILVVDVSNKKTIDASMDLLPKLSGKVFLVLNKIDKIKRDALLAITKEFHDAYNFEHVFMISAQRGDGVEDLKDALVKAVPEGPWMFEEDQISDLPMRLMAAEMTREHVYDLLHDELPYAISVETETYEHDEKNVLHIRQVIYVQRDSQKGIVIGKGGAQLKKIGSRARENLEKFLGQRVYLEIFVKTKPNWQEDSSAYNALGLDFNA